ncbi:Ger(x)C family spore germination protein [Brevibacillus sp. TJ4]|uniref:Ger(x)C family spore germination protein n=1 Tax=Brevibacillus sp. TJ4 TaxID=3234853 RepID=UPI0037D031A1
MKKQRWATALCLCLLLFSLSGCWDRREVNDVAFVVLTALDEGRKPEEYQILIQVALPRLMSSFQQGAQGGGSPVPPSMTVMAYGENLDEMYIELERQLSRDISSAHSRVVIIGEGLARRGVRDLLDEFSRNANNRLRTILVVAQGQKAAKLVDKKYGLETFISDALLEIVRRKKGTPSTLRDFFIASTTPGVEPSVAAFATPPQPGGRLIMDTTAIFRDYKLVGFLKQGEVMMLNSLLGEAPLDVLKVKLPEMDGQASVQLDMLDTKGKVRLVDGKLKFTFDVVAEGHLRENTSNLDLSNPLYVRKLDQALKKKIEDEYRNLFTKLQKEFKADSVGLGAMVYRKYPEYWKQIEKDWPKLFPEQQVTWNVTARINEIGIIGPPLILPEKEVAK